DASAYTGIKFDMSGTVSSLSFRVGTSDTYDAAEGGTCTTTCYGHYEKDVSSFLGSATQTVVVPFSSLMPAPFGSPPPFDKSAIFTILFLTLDVNTGHSFTIDNIELF